MELLVLDMGGRCGRCGLRALLLLAALLVVRAAADCSRPQGSDSTVLTEAALLLNDFPEGTDVTLECAKGYVKEAGSGITTCTGGAWSEPDLHCKKKDCGPPDPLPNMSFDTSAGTLYGAIVAVHCDKGYLISGVSYKQCYATGWSGKAKCELVTCEVPPEVANGKSSWDTQDEPKYGEMIQYACDEGYTLTGNSIITCNENGEYDSEPPECKGVTAGSTLSPTIQPQEASTSADASATPTAYRDKTVTATAAPAETEGGKDIHGTEDKGAVTSVAPTTPSIYRDKHNRPGDTNKDFDYIPVIVSVICVTLAACIIALFLHKYLLRRKGSRSANGTAPLC